MTEETDYPILIINKDKGLKDCPFCGCDKHEFEKYTTYIMTCKRCRVMMCDFNLKRLYAKWNRRV